MYYRTVLERMYVIVCVKQNYNRSITEVIRKESGEKENIDRKKRSTLVRGINKGGRQGQQLVYGWTPL